MMVRKLSTYLLQPNRRGISIEARHRGSSFAFVALLKECTDKKDLNEGASVHADIIRTGLLETNPFVASTLVNMYAKCGAFEKAQEVLEGLLVRDAVAWSALVSGYTQNGHGKEALFCYEQLQCEGVLPDAMTFSSVLKACGSLRSLNKGQQVHDEVSRRGLLHGNVLLGSALVDMYSKCGALTKAREVLYSLSKRDVSSWSALIAGYAQEGYCVEALDFFEEMQREGLPPDALTFTCIIKAVASIGAHDKGKRIYTEVVRQGLLQKDAVLGSAIVDMYVNFGDLVKAREVLDGLPVQSLMAWTALIRGYAQDARYCEEALSCYEHVRREGFSPDVITYICTLTACSNIKALNKGKEIHAEVARRGLLQSELGNAIVDMYAKCGALARAREVLDELPFRELVGWSALLVGYAQEERCAAEAWSCFEHMLHEGLSPDALTFACTLKACSSAGALDKGIELHNEVAKRGLLGRYVFLGNALLDMYAKCGALAKAQEVLESLPSRDKITWNALITGYAQHGYDDETLTCFEQMQLEGFSPNEATFGCVLNACTHTGMLDEGQVYFSEMSKKYGIIPSVEHHACMVDLFGRAGHFDKALDVMKMMPSSHYIPAWSAMLSACRKWENVSLGKWAFEQAVQLDSANDAAYICMRNIYADAGMKDEEHEIEIMRLERQTWKKQEYFWGTDIEGMVQYEMVGSYS